MKKRIAEETILFISVLKWVFLASIVGLTVGFSTTVFLKILSWSTDQSAKFNYYYLLLPIAFFLSSLLVVKFAPEAEGHGTEKVIEAIHKRFGRIPAAVIPVKLLATIITIAFGGSAGKEGPCAQIGAGFSSLFADIFRFDDTDRKKLVICGVSAGFASVFGTPIAGAIFGVEVIFLGSLLYEVLLPSFISGLIAYQVSSQLGITYFYHPIKLIPVFSGYFFAEVVVMGIILGLCSFLFIEILRYFGSVSKKLKIWPPFKGLIGGLALVLFVFLFSTRYLGLGLNTIQSCLMGEAVPWFSSILKMIFTSITLAFGGSGGIVTPIFFVGATAGNVFARLLHLDLATFSALGMVGLLAGAANTPISASIMAIELFGPAISPYAAIICVISFLLTGHRSVYPSQVLSLKKSPSFQIETGKYIEEVHPKPRIREKSFLGVIFKLFDKLSGIFSRKGG